METVNPKFIGDLGMSQFENYISMISVPGVIPKAVEERNTLRLIKTAGLEDSSDPFEKMFSAFTSHIENFGATDEMERKLGSISRAYKNIEDAPYLVQEYVKNVNTGKELHLASTKPAAPKASKLKVSKTPASSVVDTISTGEKELFPVVFDESINSKYPDEGTGTFFTESFPESSVAPSTDPTINRLRRNQSFNWFRCSSRC